MTKHLQHILKHNILIGVFGKNNYLLSLFYEHDFRSVCLVMLSFQQSEPLNDIRALFRDSVMGHRPTITSKEAQSMTLWLGD
jgi:hypothetical protein